jgi:hypothetical protein
MHLLSKLSQFELVLVSQSIALLLGVILSKAFKPSYQTHEEWRREYYARKKA